MTTRRRLVALAATAMGMTAACAGTEQVPVAGLPLDVGHGSVEEVVAALEKQEVPCTGSMKVSGLQGTEQAIECTLEVRGARVLLVHFFDVQGSEDFEAETRRSGKHGAFADTWAARTEDPLAADVISRAILSRAKA